MLGIEAFWLLVQEEGVAVRTAARRWRWTDIVGYERSVSGGE